MMRYLPSLFFVSQLCILGLLSLLVNVSAVASGGRVAEQPDHRIRPWEYRIGFSSLEHSAYDDTAVTVYLPIRSSPGRHLPAFENLVPRVYLCNAAQNTHDLIQAGDCPEQFRPFLGRPSLRIEIADHYAQAAPDYPHNTLEAFLNPSVAAGIAGPAGFVGQASIPWSRIVPSMSSYSITEGIRVREFIYQTPTQLLYEQGSNGNPELMGSDISAPHVISNHPDEVPRAAVLVQGGLYVHRFLRPTEAIVFNNDPMSLQEVFGFNQFVDPGTESRRLLFSFTRHTDYTNFFQQFPATDIRNAYYHNRINNRPLYNQEQNLFDTVDPRNSRGSFFRPPPPPPAPSA